jgi:hypothetical protein
VGQQQVEVSNMSLSMCVNIMLQVLQGHSSSPESCVLGCCNHFHAL